MRIDLTTEEGQKEVWRILTEENVRYVHAGPPCGTFSRALERRISKQQRQQGAPDPKPYRKDLCPEGLPGLTGVRLIKVQKANILANFVATVVKWCLKKHVLITVENPTNSLIWELPEYKELLARGDVEKVNFQACMWGGRRDKKTSLLATAKVFNSMGVMCDHSHEHLPWGVNRSKGKWYFATAEEAEYPAKMCQEMAKLAATACDVRIPGSLAYIQPRQKPSEHTRLQRERVGVQSSKGSQRFTVPEYAQQYANVQVEDPALIHKLESMGPGRLTEPLVIGGIPCPVETKVSDLQPRRIAGGDGREVQVLRCHLAIPWTKEQFLLKSMQAKHPLQEDPILSDHTKRSVVELLTMGARACVAKARRRLQHWKEWTSRHSRKERELHARLQEVFPNVENIVKGKNLLAFKEMLKSIDHPDKSVADLMVQGFPIVGELEVSGVFETRPQRDVVIGADPKWLAASAKEVRRSTMNNVRRGKIDKITQAVYDQTHRNPDSETAKGWAFGPYSEEEIVKKHGPTCVPCRRFGLDQGKKIRLIDDFSENFHNACVTCYEKVTVDGVDAIANFAKLWSNCVEQARHDAQGRWRFKVKLSSGEVLVGVLHPQFRDEKAKLLGKCVDLEAAYRQLAVRPSQAHLSIVCVKNPETGEPEFFEICAMPFGASASVHGFNRVSAAIEAILVQILGIPCTHYFDDFTLLVPEEGGLELIEVLKEGLDLLGWKLKADKETPLDSSFIALGVVFDLSQCFHKVPNLVVKNKPGRPEAIRADIAKILNTRKISGILAQRVRGKMVFARAQTFGRVGAMANNLLREVVALGGQEITTSPAVTLAMQYWHDFLDKPPPRIVPLSPHRQPIVIFTDGCCQGEDGIVEAGFGGVMYDPEDGAYEYFKGMVEGVFLQVLTHDGEKSQIVGQAEIVPVLSAVCCGGTA